MPSEAPRTYRPSPESKRMREAVLAQQQAEREERMRRIDKAIAEVELEREAARARRIAEGEELEAVPTSRFLRGILGAAGEGGLERDPRSYHAQRAAVGLPPVTERSPASYARALAPVEVENLGPLAPQPLPPPVVTLPPLSRPKIAEASKRPTTERSPVAVSRKVAPEVPAVVRGTSNLSTNAYRAALNECSKRIVEQAIEAAGRNKTKAAQSLGLTRQAVNRILKRREWRG